MAWYKDPETGEIKEVDLFEKNNSEFPSIKSLQSTMLVVPFNVPYGAPQKNLYSDTHMASANKVSQTKGFKGFAPRNIERNNQHCRLQRFYRGKFGVVFFKKINFFYFACFWVLVPRHLINMNLHPFRLLASLQGPLRPGLRATYCTGHRQTQ